LFPGIALAKALKGHDMEIEITFVGTKQGIESKVLPREGFALKTIMSSGLLGKRSIHRWAAWCKLPVGITQSLWFLVRKRPNLVVGVGGYASGPLVLSAWVLRIPILLHEQNSVPGMTNRWLGKLADKVAVSFKESARFFPEGKVEVTGNLVREEFCIPREQVAPRDPSEKFTVLVLGGSQGAHSINMAMVDALDHLANEKESIHIVHQTGEKDFDEVRFSYNQKGFRSADVRPFIDEVAEQYRKASLVICRSGATTLAEISACGKVSVLIPFPHAAHNHQEKNARILEAADAADLILDKDVTGYLLARSIHNAMENPDQLEEREENSYRLGKREATEKVKQICLQLMEETRSSRLQGQSETKHLMSCF